MPPTTAATHAQVEALVNFMRDNEELARGLLRGADGRVRSKRLWESLCNSLNAMGSCTKTVEQWQRVWADKKHLAKKAAGAARRSASATGGGPSVAPNLSQIDLNILSVMGDGFGEPQTNSSVPAFPTGPPLREPAAISPSHAARPANPLSQEQPSTFNEALPAPVPEWRPTGVSLEIPELPMQNQPTLNPRRARQRVRRHFAADSARSRIIEVEEQRNEVLNDIKVAIQELCALVRQHITRNN